MPAVQPFKYRAFLSYSHKDAKFARWLHKGLEHFKIDKDLVGRETRAGLIPKALRPIFMDREDFAAGASLSTQSHRALDASQFLIVICSPRSAKSIYVNEEIRLFKASGRAANVIPVIFEGEPGHPELDCFPQALRFRVGADGEITSQREEPLAADARAQGDGPDLARLKVIAGLLGLPLDDVRKRAEEAARRRFRKWVAGLSIVAVGFALLAGFAEINRREAVLQKEQAESRFDTALNAASGIVTDATKLSSQLGVSAVAPQAFLKRAEATLETLAEDAGDRPQLKYRHALLLLAFSQSYEKLGQTTEWVDRARQAHRILKEISELENADPDWQHEFAGSSIRLAEAVQAQGDLAGALAGFQAAQAIAEQQGAGGENSDPRWSLLSALAKLRIGDVYRSQGNTSEALSQFKAALAIRERVAKDQDDVALKRDLSVAYQKVALELWSMRRRAEAVSQYEKALELRKEVATQEHQNAGYQRDLAIAHRGLGDLQLREQLDKAQTNFEIALGISKRLTDSDPQNMIWQRDLAVMHSKLAQTARMERNYKRALELYRKGRNMLERLSEFDPTNTGLQHDLAISNNRIGGLHRTQSRYDEARESYLKAEAILKKLIESDAGNMTWHHLLAVTEANVASTYQAVGEFGPALAGYKRAQARFKHLAKLDATRATRQSDLAISYERIGGLLMQQQDSPGAIAAFKSELAIFERLLERNPKDSDSKLKSVVPLRRLGELSGPDGATYFDRALAILEEFDKRGRLAPSYRAWIDQIKELKDSLPN